MIYDVNKKYTHQGYIDISIIFKFLFTYIYIYTLVYHNLCALRYFQRIQNNGSSPLFNTTFAENRFLFGNLSLIIIDCNSSGNMYEIL